MKVYEYTSTPFFNFVIFTKEDNVYDFLFALTKQFSQRGLLLKERICSCRSKFFPSKVDTIDKGGKMKMAELLPLEIYPFTLIKQHGLNIVRIVIS